MHPQHSVHIDFANECLWDGAERIALTPKAFALLSYLNERPARLVTKDELLDNLWRGTMVTDGVLKVVVLEIRRALRDDPRAPKFVETVHRRGYRFVGKLPERVGDYNALAVAAPTTTLVGRDAPLAALSACIERAASGQRTIALVSGAPGVGKTSLVEQLLSVPAGRERPWILRGQCLEQYGAGEAYLPIFEAFARLLRATGADVERRRLRDVLERFAPTWLAELSGAAGEVDRERLRRETLGATRERMLREVAEAIEALSRDRAVLLVLEDLHWSDWSTLDLVGLLARRREAARLCVIATLRPIDALDADHPLRGLRHELSLHKLVTEIDVPLLDTAALQVWLDRRFAPHEFPPALAAALHLRTEGHPLFTLHVIDWLEKSGAIARAGGVQRLTVDPRALHGDVPDSLRKLIESSFEQLTPEEQRTLQAASVAGVEFGTAALAAELELDELDVETVCEGLARRRLFLRSAGASEYDDGSVVARYAFHHSLYQNVLYARIAPAQRARFHQRVAERGERAYGPRAGEIAAELALHFEQGRDTERALYYRMLAARTDSRRHASREAEAHLLHALGLCQRFIARDRAAVRMDLDEELGLVRRSRGDMQGAAGSFQRLADTAESTGDADRQLRAQLYLASVLFWIDRERCLAAVDAASRLAAGLPQGAEGALLRAHARGYCGHWYLNLLGLAPEHVAACEGALSAARAAGDKKLSSLHAVRWAYAEILRARHVDAISAAEAGEQLAVEAGDPFDLLLVHFFRAWAELFAGRLGAARATLARALEMAQKNEHEQWTALYRIVLAQVSVHAADFRGALELAAQGVEHAREQRAMSGQILFHGLLVEAHAALGAGRRAQAERVLLEVESELARPGSFMDWMLFPLLHSARAELALLEGDELRAEQATAALAEHAARGADPTWTALAARYSARLAQARGDAALAKSEIERAVRAVEGGSAPLAAWRVFASAAELLGAKQGAPFAKRAQVAAESLADSLGDEAAGAKRVLAALARG